MKEFFVTSPHAMPCPIISRLKTQTLWFLMQTLKWNVIHMSHLQANETSQHVKTHHVRHIFTCADKTITK